MNNRSNITSDEMREAAQVFLDALQYTLGNMPTEGQVPIKQFLAQLVIKEKPYLLVTQEGIAHAMELAWSNAAISDFLMRLSFAFFARLGHDDEFVDGLCGNLARGCALVARDPQNLNAVPTAVAERLSDMAAATQLIRANRWLVVILMIQLFVTVGEENNSKR